MGDLEARTDPRETFAKPDAQGRVRNYFEKAGASLRTAAHRKATLVRLVYPTLGDRPINEIERDDIADLLDGTKAPAMADHTLAYLRKVLNWYAVRRKNFRSPIVPGMARTKPKERARERTLTDEEIRAVWRIGLGLGLGVFGHFLRFLLLTGARRGEAADMSWSEHSGRDWTLPAARNKTKRDLVRPLSAAALATLPAKRAGAFVFTTDDGATPISGFSKFKLAFDKASGVGGWTLHDLRRTARSLMSRAGVSPDVAERCLGHVIPGVRGTYDRYSYYDEKARAFEALASLVDRIVNPRENVVQFTERANG